MKATAELAKHSDIEDGAECEGSLISTCLSDVKCGSCGKVLGRKEVVNASDKIEDHQTFYGLALVLIDERDEP